MGSPLVVAEGCVCGGEEAYQLRGRPPPILDPFWSTLELAKQCSETYRKSDAKKLQKGVPKNTKIYNKSHQKVVFLEVLTSVQKLDSSNRDPQAMGRCFKGAVYAQVLNMCA